MTINKQYIKYASVVIILIGCVYLMSSWTDSNVDFWVSYFRGEETDVAFIWSFILTVVLNGLALIANIISEIAELIVR